jgi:hypothetical protein
MALAEAGPNLAAGLNLEGDPVAGPVLKGVRVTASDLGGVHVVVSVHHGVSAAGEGLREEEDLEVPPLGEVFLAGLILLGQRSRTSN